MSTENEINRLVSDQASTIRDIRSSIAGQSGTTTGNAAAITIMLANAGFLETNIVDALSGLRESLTPAAVGTIAGGSTLGLEQALLANAGQPGLTVLAVGSVTLSGKVQGTSLGDGNVVEVYANGADFSNNNVLYREFMALGEPICFTGLSNGAIITSTKGFYGISEQIDNNALSPMPLLSYGLSFRSTMFFCFRGCQTYAPGQAVGNQGWISIVNGPLDSTVELTTGAGVVVQNQENIKLKPWEHKILYTDGNIEYVLNATNPIMACISASMDSNPIGNFLDCRLIMPLTNDGITWPRSGQVSAPYNDTVVNWYVRDGVSGSLNNGLGVSPDFPIDFDSAPPIGTGASDADYEPNGATRVRAFGLISAFSGADGAGSEATPLMPLSGMSQVVAQPLFIADTGDGGNSGIAISSPYVGEAKVYSWNTITNSLDLEYTVPLNRGANVPTPTAIEDQYHPSAGVIANETTEGAVLLVGQLNPGVIIANVPITVVFQNGSVNLSPTIRSQNGTTTSGIRSNSDETLSLGVTPEERAAEIRQGVDGLLYRREINGVGDDDWVLA